MHIRVGGRSNYVTNKELKYAAQWFLQLLLSRQKLRHVDLQISLRKGPLFDDDQQIWASILALDDRYCQFHIILDNQISRRRALRSLAHEIVHLKDYATRRLISYRRGSRYIDKWCGEVIPEHIDYWDSPFEIEAYGREEGLYQRYKMHLKQKQSKDETIRVF